MSSTPKLPPPKALLFDIGGVCVISPFSAILTYEQRNSIPIGYINYAIQAGPPTTGAWQLIERGEVILDSSWFTSFTAQLSRPEIWTQFWQTKTEAGKRGDPVPPVPKIEGEKLFWEMMRISRRPDPYMYPALKKLVASGKFVIGALSNTVAYPDGIKDDEGVLFTKGLQHDPHPNPYAGDSQDIKDVFDVFVSSAHVGLRKPDAKAYEYAVKELDRISKERGKGGVRAEEVLFLDDIGANLKGGRKCGLRTLKVELGKVREAVEVLEGETGVRLLDDRGRAKL